MFSPIVGLLLFDVCIEIIVVVGVTLSILGFRCGIPIEIGFDLSWHESSRTLNVFFFGWLKFFGIFSYIHERCWCTLSCIMILKLELIFES
jgi:hypothetical protein